MTSFLNRLKARLAGLAPTPMPAPTPAPSVAPNPSPVAGQAQDPLDYDKLIPLDAESLAEEGILSAYEELLPLLRQFTPAPLEITQDIDHDAPSYCVAAGGKRFEIWSPGIDAADGAGDTARDDGWERATVAFFEIANATLQASPHKFYALYGGNDLAGMFLTDEEAAAARRALPQRSDWPWLPVNEPPHYGYPGH